MRRISPALGGALVLIVTMSVGRFAYTPILPYMRDVDGLSTAAAGWVASANYLGYLVGAASARPLAGRFGLRPTMRAGLVLSAATTLGMAVTSAAPAWAALRLAGGAASAWGMIAVSAMVLAAAGDDRRRVANVMFAGVGVGIVAVHAADRAVRGRDRRPGPHVARARARRLRRRGRRRPPRRLRARSPPGDAAARRPHPAAARRPAARRLVRVRRLRLRHHGDVPRADRARVGPRALAGGRHVVRRRRLVGRVDVARGAGRCRHRRAPGHRPRPRVAGRRRAVGGVRAGHARRAHRGDAARGHVRRDHRASASTSPDGCTRPTRRGRSP